MDRNDYRLMVSKMSALGFRESTRGTYYLRTAVEEYERGMYLTKELYPALAKRFGTTAVAVERAMRYAVHSAAEQCPPTARKRFFGSDDPDNATVGEFLLAMKVYLEYGL